MDEGKIFGKSISFPVRLDADGRVAWSSGPENIRESIKLILLTEPRERLFLPDFGVGPKQFLFQPNVLSTHRQLEERITRSLNRWEPRIRVQSVNVGQDPENPLAAIAVIQYALVTTGAQDRISLTLNLSAD